MASLDEQDTAFLLILVIAVVGYVLCKLIDAWRERGVAKYGGLYLRGLDAADEDEES